MYLEPGHHIMLDLETLGQTAGSAVAAIGAVEFGDEGLTGRTFYERIDWQTAINAGLTIDGNTMKWWMEQSDEARGELVKPGKPLREVLRLFANWIGPNRYLWGNGADFDNAMLATAYAKTGIKQPWNFWNNRCYRTVKNLHPAIKLEREGTYHHALDDAKSQATHLLKLLTPP